VHVFGLIPAAFSRGQIQCSEHRNKKTLYTATKRRQCDHFYVCSSSSGGSMSQTTYAPCSREPHTFIAPACVCVCECGGMRRGEGEGGGMTNSGRLKPLGLNTIVVAERRHYWKWLSHRGRPLLNSFFPPSPRIAMTSVCFPSAHMHSHTQRNTHTHTYRHT